MPNDKAKCVGAFRVLENDHDKSLDIKKEFVGHFLHSDFHTTYLAIPFVRMESWDRFADEGGGVEFRYQIEEETAKLIFCVTRDHNLRFINQRVFIEKPTSRVWIQDFIKDLAKAA